MVDKTCAMTRLFPIPESVSMRRGMCRRVLLLVAFAREQRQRWAKIIKATGVKIDR